MDNVSCLFVIQVCYSGVGRIQVSNIYLLFSTEYNFVRIPEDTVAAMPRAFLITHRRYNSVDDGEQRESSPEHKVSLPEAPTSPNAVQPVFYPNRSYEDDHITDGNSSSTDCPDDLYNLTKLAEVSLAAAAGQLYHHRHLKAVPVISQLPVSEDTDTDKYPISYAHKLFDRGVRGGQRQRSQINEPRSSGVSASTASVYGSTGSASPELEVTHECPDCGKRYSTSSNLARHRQTHRSLADKKARRCPHCDKVYVSMPAYSMHVRTHNQGCKCHFCGKCFSRPWLLQGHIRTHTGEKPFKCTVCQKAFADKSNLRAHIQTHSNTKPHVCGRCGKAFALKSYLYKHEESSCMRGQRTTSEQSPQPIAAPTPVIVHPERPYRSTVISPNPERILYSSVEHPSAILTASRYCMPDEQPVDFSASRDVFSASSERKTGYAIGLAIAV